MSTALIRSIQSCSRREAASLLRHTREQVRRQAADLPADATAVDWVLLALPDSLPAWRLAIASLVLAGDEQYVDALLARSLLRWPMHAALLQLQAQRLLEQARLIEAAAAVELALHVRPSHVATLLCAGRIDAARGDHHRAAQRLQQAFDRGRCDQRQTIGRELAHAQLAAGLIEQAEATIRSLTGSCHDLLAQVRRAQGRLREAIELLQQSSLATEDSASREAVICGLIGLLEQVGDHAQLRAVLRELEGRCAMTRICAGMAWLTLGEFEQAQLAVAQVRDDDQHAPAAQAVTIAAATMSGELAGLDPIVQSFRAAATDEDHKHMAAAWARAIQGRVIADQRSAATAGADPSATQLPPLLRRALQSIEESLAAEHRLEAAAAAELRRQQSLCRALLERTITEPVALPA